MFKKILASIGLLVCTAIVLFWGVILIATISKEVGEWTFFGNPIAAIFNAFIYSMIGASLVEKIKE